MHPNFRFVLIILSVFLLNGCAQVGVLSGGETDIFAPAAKRISPEQKTTNFSGNSFEIEFSEFVELVNPQQNIVMVPAHTKPQVKLSKKTLEVSWTETLQPNTTYSVYMNGLVKDITEGNDSLMTYVFSTGPLIDSLYYETMVENAWTNEPVNKCLVGLYTSSDSLKPLYFSRTDASGYVRISNIKADTYTVRAFPDDDKDLKPNKTELRGFRSNPVQIDTCFSDSVKLRLFEPPQDKIRTFKFMAPGAFAVGATSDLNNAHISLNGEEILNSAIRMVTNDSLLFFAKTDTLTSVKAVLKRNNKVDTLSYFLTKSDKTIKTALKPLNKSGIYKPDEALAFELNDQIIGINPSLIKLTDALDSSQIEVKNFHFEQNKLTLEIDRAKRKNIKCHFQKGAFRLLNSIDNEDAIIPVELKSEKDLGTIALNVWENNSPLLVHILLKNELVHTLSLNASSTTKIPYLFPGEYNFRVIEDSNGNGKWDSGDEMNSIQPEIVRFFKGPKVRANWEVEVQLDPKEQ